MSGRRCAECGDPLASKRATTCSPKCRARRSRKSRRQPTDSGPVAERKVGGLAVFAGGADDDDGRDVAGDDDTALGASRDAVGNVLVPSDLGGAAARYFMTGARMLAAEGRLDDVALDLLERAARCRARLDAAERLAATTGPVVTGANGGIVASPATREARAEAKTLADLEDALGLAVSSAGPVSGAVIDTAGPAPATWPERRKGEGDEAWVRRSLAGRKLSPLQAMSLDLEGVKIPPDCVRHD